MTISAQSDFCIHILLSTSGTDPETKICKGPLDWPATMSSADTSTLKNAMLPIKAVMLVSIAKPLSILEHSNLLACTLQSLMGAGACYLWLKLSHCLTRPSVPALSQNRPLGLGRMEVTEPSWAHTFGRG